MHYFAGLKKPSLLILLRTGIVGCCKSPENQVCITVLIDVCFYTFQNSEITNSSGTAIISWGIPQTLRLEKNIGGEESSPEIEIFFSGLRGGSNQDDP